jgi:hypothetical protein
MGKRFFTKFEGDGMGDQPLMFILFWLEILKMGGADTGTLPRCILFSFNLF